MHKTRWVVSILVLLAVPPAFADAVTEVAQVTITGGPNAGSWTASSEKGGCSAGLTGPGSWGNQLSSSDKDPKKFNSLQLIVTDAKKAASGSKEFLMTVGFGPLMNRSATYTIETRPAEKKKAGSGTVTVDDRGATAKVTFSATTADGIKLDGSIDCKSVMRNS